MGTSNFRTQKNFPLYTHGDFYYTDDEGNSYLDNISCEMYVEELAGTLKEVNAGFNYHEITMKSGYYAGIQLYVNEEHAGIEDYDNEDCKYEFGFCRSKALRAYKSEQNKVKKAMAKIAKDFGMDELKCLGVFSNGEAFYKKVA